MKKQIKTLQLNKSKISELSATNTGEVKGGKSGNIQTCPTWPLCFTQTTCPTEDPGGC
jgi:hypothetical protein